MSQRNRASLGRIGAARALIAVEDGEHLEDALVSLELSSTERAAAWQLTMGVLRNRGRVDAALRTALTRPLGGLDAGVRAVLRLGCWERLFGGAPDHAAVDQSVEVARAIGCGPASGLVNAVVRHARLPEELSAADQADLPAWLLDRWVQRYGETLAIQWAEAITHQPPLFVVLRQPESWPVGLVAEATDVEGVVRVTGWKGTVLNLPGFAEGQLWVQDLSAVRVADLVPVTGSVLDATAAPGGKAFRLASRGARVLAVDRGDARLDRVAEGASRLGLRVAVQAHDWNRGPLPGVPTFDAVLLDAPCTGLGTVRRHPEIKWRRMEPDLLRAAATQASLLRTVAAHVHRGGVLVYAVCSAEPEEGKDVVNAFLAEAPEFSLQAEIDTSPALEGADAHVGFVLKRGLGRGR